LSGLLVWDLLARWWEADIFYAGTGAFPPGSDLSLRGTFPHPSFLNLTNAPGALHFTFALFLVVFLLLGLGIWTPFAKIASFVALVSLLNRNISTRDGGDIVRLSLLAWSLLLPVDKKFSFTTWLRQRRDRSCRLGRICDESNDHVSLAGVGIFFQIGLIYLYAACAKWGPTWHDGSALYYALHLRELATPLGAWLRERPQWLLRLLTHAAWFVEFSALPLLMTPIGQPWLRRLAIFSLCSLHLGIALTMRLAIFEATMIVACLVFVGKNDWALLGRITRTALQSGPPFSVPTAGLTRWRRTVINSAAAVLLLLIVVDGYNRNIATRPGGPATLRRPWVVRAVLEIPQMVQDWRMFAPNPYVATEYWIAKGYTADGREVDPLSDGAPEEWIAQSSRYWYKSLNRLSEPRTEGLRLHLAKFLIERHNRVASPNDQIGQMSLFHVQEATPPPGAPRVALGRVTKLWPPTGEPTKGE
jgi:hypothetical protein